jgi:3-oxoacyl-[acyl-carrier protein] reductase
MSAAATALVTGASRRIGLAVAQEFLRRGMAVCITGRKEDSLVEAVEALGVPERTLAVAGSSADPGYPPTCPYIWKRVLVILASGQR